MKPIFSNVFAVMKNNTGTEVLIEFGHQYAENSFTENGKNEPKAETVSHIVMTYESAVALNNLLTKMIGDEQIRPNI